MQQNPLWFEVLRWILIVGGTSYFVVQAYKWVRRTLRYAHARKELVKEIERTESDEPEFDAAVHEAASSIPARCTQMCSHTERAKGRFLCGLPVEKTVVEHRNLVCDRYVVGRCAAGHEFMRAIIDDEAAAGAHLDPKGKWW